MTPPTEPTFHPNTSVQTPGKSSVALPSANQAMFAIFSRILVMLGVFAATTGSFYLILYFRTGIQQALWAAIPILLSVALIPLAYRLVRKGATIQAGIITLIGVCMAYGVNELLWIGLTPYHLIGGILLILLTSNLVLPDKRRIWLLAIGLYILYIFLAYSTHPITRSNISGVPALLPYAIGTNILLVIVLAALIIRSLRTRTIRRRLLINFVMIVLPPVILSAIISSIFSAQNAQERVYGQLESIVTLKEAEINAWVNNLRANLLLAMPASDQVWVFQSSLDKPKFVVTEQELYLTAATIKTNLEKIVTQSQVFDEMFLINSRGVIFISTHDYLVNTDQAEEQYFKEGSKDTYITPLQHIQQANVESGYQTGTNRFRVIISTPVIDTNGETVGVLAGQASPEKLNEIMSERAGLGKTGETYLLNPQLILITESRFQGYTAGEKYQFADVIQQALQNGKNGKGTYRSYRDNTVIGAYRWQPELQLLLIAENGQSEALMSTYQTLGINLGLVVIATLFALGAGWYAARGITDPLSKLSKTAEEIAAGKLTISAEVEQEDEVGALAKSFNSMTDQLRFLVEGLEQRVNERTREVERHSLQLQVAAEVARDATSIRDLSELLNRAVNLVNENFGFYYAGIFLIDEQGEFAVLRAATGEAGQQMLRDGHKLVVSQGGIKEQQSLVGFVSWAGVARIASDVGTEAIHFKNPLLPDTRSEVALPLKVGTRVIGVLDVQSVDEGAFTEENVRILQTLADQLAIAIENARLFQEMTQTVRELETVYGQYTREAWLSLKSRGMETRGKPVSDYRYRGLTIETAQEPNIEASEALNSGRTVVISDPAQSTLAIPLKLRGQTIGVINLRFKGQELPAEAVNTYEEIANRLVLVLENARLLQEAQQLAKREQQINLISTQIRSSPTTDSILRNTVRELGNVLGASKTFIQLGWQTKEPGDGKPQPGTVVMVKTNGDSKENSE
jgi:GAF domain-containing protein/HAMP domain-containing protein